MTATNVQPFIVRVRELGRLLAIFAGGSLLILSAAHTGTDVGAIFATAFGLLTTAGIYCGQRLATWRIVSYRSGGDERTSRMVSDGWMSAEDGLGCGCEHQAGPQRASALRNAHLPVTRARF